MSMSTNQPQSPDAYKLVPLKRRTATRPPSIMVLPGRMPDTPLVAPSASSGARGFLRQHGCTVSAVITLIVLFAIAAFSPSPLIPATFGVAVYAAIYLITGKHLRVEKEDSE